MANTYLIDAAKDAALNYLDTNVTQLFIVSQLVANYTEASDTYKLGVKASPSISTATDDSTAGRKITISAITDGTVSTGGNFSTPGTYQAQGYVEIGSAKYYNTKNSFRVLSNIAT